VNRLADALARPDVWCLLALDGPEVVGHVAFSAFTLEDPESPPPGTINLWQLFVRPAWQGRGLAKRLMEAALEEARLPGLTRVRLWTPPGPGPALL
jgi:predicted N-acetyltransferase YhbS